MKKLSGFIPSLPNGGICMIQERKILPAKGGGQVVQLRFSGEKCLPGLGGLVLGDPEDAAEGSGGALMVAAIRDPDPVVFMEPKRSYRAFREEVPEEEEAAEIGKAEVVQEGTDLTVVAWGAMMRPTLQAAREVREKRKAGIEVIDLLTISPMDGNTIAESVKKTGRCVVVQEAPRSVSMASEVVARINDKVLLSLEAPVNRVANYDVVTPYFGRENMYLPTPERIQQAISKTIDFR